jgi:hypothetical protein
MAVANRDSVRNALDLLEEGQARFAEREMQAPCTLVIPSGASRTSASRA